MILIFHLVDFLRINIDYPTKITNIAYQKINRDFGVSPEMITQYKTTKKLPKLDTFAKLCEVLDISADEILGLKNKMHFIPKCIFNFSGKLYY